MRDQDTDGMAFALQALASAPVPRSAAGLITDMVFSEPTVERAADMAIVANGLRSMEGTSAGTQFPVMGCDYPAWKELGVVFSGKKTRDWQGVTMPDGWRIRGCGDSRWKLICDADGKERGRIWQEYSYPELQGPYKTQEESGT